QTALLGLVLAAGLVGAVQLVQLARDTGHELRDWMLRRWTLEDWAALGLVAFCLTIAFLTLLAALTPPSDLDWDGLTYHLAAPPLAAGLWLSIPVACWEAGTAYIDLGTALFQFTALAALTRALDHEARRRQGIDPRWAAAAGVLTGFALGTKATALIQFGLL